MKDEKISGGTLKPLRLLVVEDSQPESEIFVSVIRGEGYDVIWKRVETEADMRAALQAEAWDAVTSDYIMPRFDLFLALRVLQESGLDLPFIIISGHIGEETAVAAMKAGAHDYLMKDKLARLGVVIERELREAAERRERKHMTALSVESEIRYRRLFESAKDGILILDAETGMIVDVNSFLIELLGYTHGQFRGKKVWELGFLKDIFASRDNFLELTHKGYIRCEDLQLQKKDGTAVDVEVASNVYMAGDKKVIQCNIRDVTVRKMKEKQQKLALKVLSTLSRRSELDLLICDILQLIKDYSGMDAVAIRLRDGDDFPYNATNGFPQSFVDAEQHMRVRDVSSNIVRDKAGSPALECMCANVLSGRFDPSKPFFTQGGSFWTNCTTDLLASTTEMDRQARTSNCCNGGGYESVALIPIRPTDGIVGLLQLSDHRKGMLTPDMIKFYEDMSEGIGIAFSREKAENEVRNSEEKYRILFENSHDALMTLKPPTWAFSSGNPAALAMFGAKDQKEFVSYGLPNLSPARQPDGRASSEKAKEMIETALREGSYSFKWTHKRVNGEEFPATVILTRIDLTVTGKRFLQAIVLDISGSRRVG